MKKVTLILSIAVLVLSQSSAFAAPTDNLITVNPGFEEYATGWNHYYGGLGWWGGSSNGGGSVSAAMYNQAGMRTYEEILVRPNTDYSYSADVTGPAGTWSHFNIYNSQTSSIATTINLHAGPGWTTYAGSVNTGNSSKVQIGLINPFFDTIAHDNLYLGGDDSFYQPGVFNGTVANASGWAFSGGAYFASNISRSSDGTGAIGVYDSGWGTRSGKATQWMLVDQDVDYMINFAAKAAGEGRFFGYTLKDADGNVLVDNPVIGQGGDWSDYSISFNSGLNDVVYLDFTSYSGDAVTIDEVSLVPEPATMGLLAIGGLVGLIRRKK